MAAVLSVSRHMLPRPSSPLPALLSALARAKGQHVAQRGSVPPPGSGSKLVSARSTSPGVARTRVDASQLRGRPAAAPLACAPPAPLLPPPLLLGAAVGGRESVEMGTPSTERQRWKRGTAAVPSAPAMLATRASADGISCTRARSLRTI